MQDNVGEICTRNDVEGSFCRVGEEVLMGLRYGRGCKRGCDGVEMA